MNQSENPKNYLQPPLSENQLVIKPVRQMVSPQAVYLLAQIRHPALPVLRGVEPVAIGDQPATDCFLFDFMPGTSLDRLDMAEREDFPLLTQIRFFAELARTVDFLHHQSVPGLMHLDIKPANVLLGPDLRPRLIDFGAMKLILPEEENEPSSQASAPKQDTPEPLAFTEGYAAPEQLQGHPCPASDLYALGMTLLSVTAGYDPGRGSPSALQDALCSLPPDLSGIIRRCLQSRPEQRFASGGELALALERIAARLCGDDGPSAEPAGQSCPETPGASPPDPAASVEEAAAPGPVNKDADPARLLCVWDGAEFGCELAVQLRQYYAQVLVIDCDLINPQADLLLGHRNSSNFRSGSGAADNLSLALAETIRGNLTGSHLRRLVWPSLADGVDVLVFGENLDDYEHLPTDSLVRLIEVARLCYPVVILLCNRFIYDAFTCLGLLAADQILVPLPGSNAAFRSVNRCIDFLAQRRQLDPERIHLIAFAYDEGTDLSLGTLDVLSRGHLIGSIRTTPERQRQRSTARPYAIGIGETNAREYDTIIARLNMRLRKDENHADRHFAHPVRRTIRLRPRSTAATRGCTSS